MPDLVDRIFYSIQQQEEEMDPEFGYSGSETEEVQEITEQELLQMLDQEQDSLTVCQRLFTTRHFVTGEIMDQNRVEQLYERGYVIMDDCFPVSDLVPLYVKAIEMKKRQELQCASGVRLEDDPFRDRTARDDAITFLHPTDSEFAYVTQQCLAIQRECAQFFQLLNENEIQLAVYPPNGGKYDMHRDAFPTDDPSDTEQRRLTFISYLNPDWDEEKHGGVLRLFRKGKVIQDISPKAGRSVLFLSGVMDHQVMPAFRERVAITCWMK
jgi:Rps23 Pro-64 3,4-dihydroxylase Tpa1-like proline 4-hydroxylase